MEVSPAKEKAIEKIIATFRAFGFEGASLSEISKATGLGKSSLYHYFPNGKNDMAKAAFEKVIEDYTKLVSSPLGDKSLSIDARLKKSMDGLCEFYSDGARSCLLNIFSIGGANEYFQSEIRKATSAIIHEFAQIAIESGVSKDIAQQNAQKAMIELQGALVLVRTMNDKNIFSKMIHNLPKTILA